ncbi:hypothetical protein BWP39_09840 [Paraburkholderia acidicola]|uniref:Peptidase S9 prolyl oligopeptidase catalytic domain-containing protein n=2 Tax=Paraburkholderia acidicola TaxID=1912599 RepID=A0A2A4F365_9BURK|nr:hypothetical protein BWP39_09840 [Paraburkholderia acidicola]
MFDDQQPAKMEAMAVAATFASRGYIVIAPNYGGYGESTMSYHPYLNGDLLGKDSADALSAAYSTFNAMNVVANGNVYLTGISEGGYSTMAANKELQQRGQQVKAVVPISSPAAISLLVDQTAHGNISNGGTFFMPLLLNSWQHQSGDIFQNSNEVYATKYANSPDGIPTPFKGMSFQDVVNKKIVPEEQLFPDSSNVPNKSNFFKFSGPDALLSDNFSKDFVADTENNSCDSDFFDKSKEGFPFEPDRIKFQAGGFQLLNAAIISILPSSYSQAAATAIDIIANLKDPSGGSTPAGNVIKNALKLIFPSQADQITNMIGNFTDIVAYEKKPLLSVDHTAATYASIAPKFNCTPKNTFRKAALRNDLRRDWIPPNPMLMCGGGLDPTVPFISSVATIANLRNQGVPSSMADLLDLEVIPSPNSPYARIFGLFKIYEGISFYNDNGATQSSGIKKFLTNYHAGTVSPFCLMAAKMYFDTNN